MGMVERDSEAVWRETLDIMTGQFDWLCDLDPCRSVQTPPWTLISPLFYRSLFWHLPRMRDATQPWPHSHPGGDLWLRRGWPLTPDLTAWLIAECFMIYEYLLCMINGATGGTATQQKGKYCKRDARQCKGLCRGKAFCLKMAPTLVEPYIILTFLNVAGLWLSVALRRERILLKVLRRLMHTKESHALIFVNPRHKVFVEFKRKHKNSWPRHTDRDPWEVTHARICPWLRIPHLLPPPFQWRNPHPSQIRVELFNCSLVGIVPHAYVALNSTP